jgi:hypothetical protein
VLLTTLSASSVADGVKDLSVVFSVVDSASNDRNAAGGERAVMGCFCFGLSGALVLVTAAGVAGEGGILATAFGSVSAEEPSFLDWMGESTSVKGEEKVPPPPSFDFVSLLVGLPNNARCRRNFSFFRSRMEILATGLPSKGTFATLSSAMIWISSYRLSCKC